jgi:hypothetical protein
MTNDERSPNTQPSDAIDGARTSVRSMCERDRLAYEMLTVEGRSLRTRMSAVRSFCNGPPN